MKNIILSIVTLFVLLSQPLFALVENEIKTTMSSKIQEATMLLQHEYLSKETKAREIFIILDSVFDYKLMSRLTLGKSWKKLSSEQQNKFKQLFTQKLKNSYIDKLHLYTDQKIIINDLRKIKSNRIQLPTQLIGKEEVYDIIYKFYKNKKEQWYIYDVDIIGVSIIQTYRKQFAGILEDKTFDELIQKLQTKVQ